MDESEDVRRPFLVSKDTLCDSNQSAERWLLHSANETIDDSRSHT